jgi:hypothetical protein
MLEGRARSRTRWWILGERLVTLFVLAVLFNYPWELLQSHLI